MGKIPTVVEGLLKTDSGEIINLVSPEWLLWLGLHTSFRYESTSSQSGFTARVEKSGYWYAYRRVAGKLHKRYIGKLEELTKDRLEEIAVLLSEPSQPRQPKVTDKVAETSPVTRYATSDDIAQLWQALAAMREEIAAALGKLKAR